jgi:hypothetical protein
MNPNWKMCHNYADPLKVKKSGMGVVAGGKTSGGKIQ